MFDELVLVLKNEKINNVYWKITLKSSSLAKRAKPGHFLNLLVEDSYDPFLRRPFSIYRVSGGNKIEILYDVIGKGTQLLATLKPGNKLKALGPLGNTFSKPASGEISILVAGGVGVAPLIFWDEVYKANYFLMGFPDKNRLLPDSEFRADKSKKFIATDNGSAGKKGFVTELLKEILKKENPKRCILYTCGPTVMMDAVRNIAERLGARGELSVEEKMACGVGACLGCVIKTISGQKTSCKDGPVFNFNKFKGVECQKVKS